LAIVLPVLILTVFDCSFGILDLPFLIAPSVLSNVYLSSDGIKSTNIKQSEQ
jgi:hypothetical protein